MGSLAVFLVTTMTATLVISGTTTLHCSDLQQPDVTSGGDGVIDFDDEAVALQYCIVDNCTIVRIDNGQVMDIVYITDGHIVAMPRDTQASMVIAKMDEQLVCQTPVDGISYILVTLFVTLLLTINIYNITIHLAYKNLRNLIGKLLMLYSLFTVGRVLTACTLFIDLQLQIICYGITMGFMITYIGSEAVATCILTHITYLMRLSYKSQQNHDGKNKLLLKRYVIYVLSIMIASLFLILTYDIVTGNWRDTIQANGQCTHLNQPYYDTSFMFAIITINKLIQIMMFVVYLFYCYKLRDTYRNGTASDKQTSQRLFKIAVTMGATVGASQLIFAFNKISGSNLVPTERIATMLLVVQQCIIVFSLRYVKMVYKVACKRKQ